MPSRKLVWFFLALNVLASFYLLSATVSAIKERKRAELLCKECYDKMFPIILDSTRMINDSTMVTGKDTFIVLSGGTVTTSGTITIDSARTRNILRGALGDYADTIPPK